MGIVDFIKIALFVLITGCQPDLERQPKLKYSSFREPVAGTIAFSTKQEMPPEKINRELLEKGRSRFEIFCSVCHGWTGYGDGMAVKRGFPAPLNFHTNPVQSFTPQIIYTFIIQGSANMPSYASKLSVEERWAVVYYVKALQLSEHFPAKELNDKDREILNGEPQ